MSAHSTEIWKDVMGYENYYQVSNRGRVRSVDRTCFYTTKRGGRAPRRLAEKILKPGATIPRHLFVNLSKNNQAKAYLVHRLVLEAFVGPCPEGMECCHNDGNPQNNRLENLRWDTHRNNQLDSLKHGTANFCNGENHQNAKLADADAEKIRLLRSRGWPFLRLAKKFNVCVMTIRHAVYKTGRWSQSTSHYDVQCLRVDPPVVGPHGQGY